MERYRPLIQRVKMTTLIVGLVWSLAYLGVAVEKKEKMLQAIDADVVQSYDEQLYNKRISNDTQPKSDMYIKQRHKKAFHVH